MNQVSGVIQREHFYAQIAAMLRMSVEELEAFDGPIEAGLDSVRLLVLAERWQAAGVPISFLELAQNNSFSAWWMLIQERDLRTQGASA